MNIYFFEGAAGTGKTYNLIGALRNTLLNSPLEEHQRVLALTFMHGSRKRLEHKLDEIKEIKKKIDCLTFDSFAWEIAQRWNEYIEMIKEPKTDSFNQYDITCLQASKMLENATIQRWVSCTYPIIIIDEVQDLSAYRFGIVKGLSVYSTLIVAGDAFQNLEVGKTTDEYLAWLKEKSDHKTLTEPHRTNDQGLLQVASNIRNGEYFINKLIKNEKSYDLGNFKLITVPSWQMLAWSIGYQLFNLKNNEVAILTLANKETIVENALKRVQNEVQNLSKKWGTTFGPYKDIFKTKKDEDLAKICLSELNLKGKSMGYEDLIKKCENIEIDFVRVDFRNWLNKKKNLGYIEFIKSELDDIILKIIRNRRIYRKTNQYKRQVLTIHQAKNREFDHVIVLWTFGISSTASNEYLRKLLYNAITRAKKACTVILMGEDRINKPPFSNLMGS